MASHISVNLSHLDTTRPVGVHAAVLVVEALQLELKVRPEHQGLVHLGRRVNNLGKRGYPLQTWAGG